LPDIQLKKIERAVLVGLVSPALSGDESSDEASMAELGELLLTACGELAGTVVQNRPHPDPKSFIGEGKALEVKALCEAEGADLVVFDNPLSPSQVRALEGIIGARVIDRSAIILDIFAARAKTAEGKLQVELAQYKHLLPRLSGLGAELSRLGGGIGTRGPGESQLETDRRHIRRHISRLEGELSLLRRTRELERRWRRKNEIPIVPIVGYTNAGKSTLFNLLTGSDIEANDRLFDTLDNTSRLFSVSDTLDVMLVDTVGFIRRLPHHLIEAFRATLEELRYADLILHVVDASSEHRAAESHIADKLIDELSPPGLPRLYLLNKCDLVEPDDLPAGSDILQISAGRGRGIEALKKAVSDRLEPGLRELVFRIPYEKSGLVDSLYRDCKVSSCEYGEDAITIVCVCDAKVAGRMEEFIAR